MFQGADQNPHGFGFAIIAGDKIISERTMSAKRSIARFLMFREQYPDSYAIWHSRIATHGVKNESNCHPFQVGNDRLTYLAHNGILSVEQPKDDKRSDSRVFAEEVLPQMGGVCSLDNDTVFEMVSKWASGSKLAILTLDPKAKKQLYIINEKAGSWDDHHVWWSNTRHRPVERYDSWASHRSSGSSYMESLTLIISIPNQETGLWEKPNFVGNVYRKWQSGDVWNQVTYGFNTPEPGTPIAGWKPKQEGDNVFYLPAVRNAVATALDKLESEEEDDPDEEIFAPVEMECPYCGQMTDLQRDDNYCLHCNLCFECGMHRLTCMCYFPATWRGHSYN